MLLVALLCSIHLRVSPPVDTARTVSGPIAVVPLDTVVAAPPAADSLAAVDTLARPLNDLRSDIALDSVPLASGVIQPVRREEFRPGMFDMITNLPGDWLQWGKSTFTVENIPLIAGMGALTTGLVVTDYETWQPFKKWYEGSETARNLSDMFVGVGDGKFQFGLALAFGAYGLIADDSKALRTASQTVEVILACGGVVQLLKHTTGRESPFCATTKTGRWALLPDQIEYAKHVPHYDAFPSGHIATALATLTVIADNYPEQKWIRYIGYPAVGAVGVALVATSIHWWSDIPLGLALGYHFGKIVAGHGSPTEKQAYAPTGISPDLGVSVLSDGAPALNCTWRW